MRSRPGQSIRRCWRGPLGGRSAWVSGIRWCCSWRGLLEVVRIGGRASGGTCGGSGSGDPVAGDPRGLQASAGVAIGAGGWRGSESPPCGWAARRGLCCGCRGPLGGRFAPVPGIRVGCNTSGLLKVTRIDGGSACRCCEKRKHPPGACTLRPRRRSACVPAVRWCCSRRGLLEVARILWRCAPGAAQRSRIGGGGGEGSSETPTGATPCGVTPVGWTGISVRWTPDRGRCRWTSRWCQERARCRWTSRCRGSARCPAPGPSPGRCGAW